MLRRIKDDKVKDPFQDMLRRINEVESKKKTKMFDMLRRIKDDKVKDPFQDMLRSINEVESKKKKHLNIWYVKKDKDDKVKDFSKIC